MASLESEWLNTPRFADSFKDHVGDVRFRADGGRVPDKFAVSRGRVAPGRLAAVEAVANNFSRLAEHHGNVLEGMQAVADEERDHNNPFGPRHLVTVADAGILLHECRVDFGVKILRANQLDLPLNRFARILVVARPVPRDE